MQGVQTVHLRHSTTSGCSNDIICDGKRTQGSQRQRTQGTGIENPHQLRKILESLDEEVVQILARTSAPQTPAHQSKMQLQQLFSQQVIKTNTQKEAYTST